MRNKSLLYLRTMLADRIKQLYLNNYSSKSIAIDDFKNITTLYVKFKECSAYEKSYIDELIKEVYTWDITCTA